MKTRFTTLLLGIFCLSLFATSCAQGGSSKKSKDAEVTFSVDMGCASCQKKIEAGLPAENGVKDIKVNLEKKEVWVLYETGKTDKAKLIEAIAQLGYTATEIPAK